MKQMNQLTGRESDAQCRLMGLPEQQAQSRRLKILAFDFSEIYEQYHRRVFSWCLRIARNTEDAEDLAQDTFLHLYRKIGTFRGESAFSTWLYRLTVNLALMRLRKKRLAQVSLDDISDMDLFSASACGGLQPPDRALAASITRADLERAFQHVPPGFRRAVFLHDGEQYTHEEIAKLTGCAVGTSKSQLHKARQRLREMLRHKWECLENRLGREGDRRERPSFRTLGPRPF